MSDARPPARASRRALTAVASVAGLALLVWQIRTVGLDTIRADLAAVGWGFLAILALSLLRFVVRSVAWTTLIGERVPVASALAASIGGDALGNITPLSLLVSEPAKALYVGGRVQTAQALAALAAENFFYSVSVAIYIVLGTAALLLAFPVDATIQWAGVIALGAMAAILAAAAWLAWQKPSVASALLARVPFATLDAVVSRVRDFEVRTYGSVGQPIRPPQRRHRLRNGVSSAELHRSVADAVAADRRLASAPGVRARHLQPRVEHHLSRDPVQARRRSGRIGSRRAGDRAARRDRHDDVARADGAGAGVGDRWRWVIAQARDSET